MTLAPPKSTTIVRSLARMMASAFVALVVLSSCAEWARAVGLTYVDAEADPNFPPVNLTPASAIDVANSTASSTNLIWDFRAFGANGTIYEVGSNEAAPEITQTLTGLTPSANYDVYIAYWSDSLDWTVKAGFTSGAGTIFNRLGPTVARPDLVAGTFASSAAWTVLPPANVGNPSLGLFREGNRTMYLGKIGTTAAAGDGTLPVFVNGGSGVIAGQRSVIDGLAYVEAGATVFLGATVNRSTGNISIVNGTDSPFSIKSYTISSASGSLNSIAWDKIGADADGDVWDIVAPVAPDASTITLTETETAAPTVTGSTLIATTGVLNLGDAWRRTPLATDVTISLTLADGTLVAVTPTYTGTAPKSGDFNLDNFVNLTDYGILMSNLHAALPLGTTAAEAYALGDITGNTAINFADFNAFVVAYDLDNGPGAFAAAVPEPGTLALAVCGALVGGCWLLSRRGGRQAAAKGASTGVSNRYRFNWESGFMKSGNRGLQLLTMLIASGCFCLMGATASAAPVTGWLKDPLNNAGSVGVPLSGEATDSPVLGDGVTDLSADNTVIYAPFPLATLLPGQQITLSGTITMVGVVQRDQVFRWGLFKDDGAAPDTGGWLGYIGESGNGSSTNLGNLWSKDPAGGTFLTATHMSITSSRGFSLGLSTNSDPGPIPADGTYNFKLTIGKYDNQNQAVIDASLIQLGGNFNQTWAQATETNATRVTTSFDRVSFLSASVSDAEKMAFSGVDVSVAPIVAPKLQVVKYAGETSVIRVLNGTGASVNVKYYEINSAGGSLNTTGWNSLDDREGADAVGAGWEEAGGSTANILSEGNLSSSMAVANASSFSLGRAFALAGAEDLTFSYGDANGALRRGLVEYVPGVLGDVNFDGIVNIFDINFVSSNWNTTGPNGDANGDKIVNIFDINLISSHWNQVPAGGATAVPEPATWVLLALGSVFFVRRVAATRTRHVSLPGHRS